MNKDIRDRYESRARIMKALAHPTRMFIVDELNHKDRCVQELTQMIGADTSTVSKHLSILKEAGIVDYEKYGTQIYYHLAAPCVMDFFSCLENMLHTNIQRQTSGMQDFRKG